MQTGSSRPYSRPDSAADRLRWPLIRVVVAGPSMVPTLRAGDALVVRRTTRAAIGDVVVARFRSAPGRLVVKRAVRRYDGGWWVEGDNPFGSDDSRQHGVADVLGRVVVRYRPKPGRVGPRPEVG